MSDVLLHKYTPPPALELDFTKADVDKIQTYSKPLVQLNQISNEALNGILKTLKLALNRGDTGELPQLLTIKETCSTLKCSRPTIYVLIKNGRLKPIHVTKKAVRILKSSVQAVAEGSV